MANELTGYDLSRNWFDFCFENPEIIKPAHTALYFFIIEHSNRMGWKEKFGLPMEMTKDAIGISNYKTYASTFNDLVEWGFIKVLQKSVNQYSATIIALVKNTKATTKALSKATLKHSQKQVQGIVCIDKPITLEPITKEPSTGISREKVIEYLKTGSLMSMEAAGIQADKLMKYYSGQSIGNLKAVCNKWLENLNNEELMPTIDEPKKMVH